MNRIPELLIALVRGARWGLPWLGLVAISVSVAYAMTVAVAGGTSTGDAASTSVVGQVPAQELAFAVPGSAAPPAAAAACDTGGGRLLYVGLNSWIPTEPKLAPCTENAP
jgi:hypothetical protein